MIILQLCVSDLNLPLKKKKKKINDWILKPAMDLKIQMSNRCYANYRHGSGQRREKVEII
ncbi:hypothetical protein HanXRQr2_Chr17g0806691 [Helianthus annuus]|uniref:Uncharacterized protein n=1 Tax=Helianthus annuus TaxID=4232 RepID=A0A9K3DKE3_HELAN|nr:hypothetical protein HanXRQr2_Chr17g0806691 [Helianthus annuus]